MLELIFIKLLEISLQASFLILVVLLMRFLFKRIPRNFVCLLWMLVAMRLVFPFEITSGFSLVPDINGVLELAGLTDTASGNTSYDTAQSEQWNADSDVAQPGEPNYSLVSDAENLPVSGNVSNAPANKASGQKDSPATVADGTSALPPGLSGILTGIWMIGMAALLSYGLISYVRTRRILQDAVHSEDNIWLSDRIETPFVLGYLKPRIYIPFSVEEEQLPYIIAHEKAHIARFDHLGKLVGYLLLGLYWFNPFVWAAYYLYCKDLELACDERVINTLGPDTKKAYSEALLACSVSNKALLQSPLAFSELGVKERIINILNYKKPGFWGIMAAIALCVIVGICFMTTAPGNEDTPTEESIATEETSDSENTVTSTETSASTDATENLSADNKKDADLPVNPWEAYADQIDAFPGEVKLDDDGNLIAAMNTADYEVTATTVKETGEPAYIWREASTKIYPLEIVNDTLQDVPARIITHEELLDFPYGEALLQQISRLYPHGTFQFILRENGILHVNIGQEDGTFLNLQYLEYTVSEDGQTAVLQDYGIGYYLLQLNDVESLEAFRRSFTGEGHTLPADTSHLPWDWLLAMNGEENDAPEFAHHEIPVVEHLDMYAYFTGDNISGTYNGFYVYEKRDQDRLLYEYRYYDDAGDIVIIMDPSDARNATTIQYNGHEIETSFPATFHSGGAGGSYSYPCLADVTGDGRPELILEWGGGGTGAFTSECYVYQLDALEQLSIDTNIYDITSQLSVTLTEFLPEEGRLHYLMEYDEQTAECDAGFDAESKKHEEIMAPDVTLEEAEAYFSYDPITDLYQSHYAGISLNTQSGKLEALIAFSTNNILPWEFIGELNFTYIWDEDAGTFVPDMESVILTGY